ncbi:MAG: hypothetical protein HYT22_00985 [Candidatus Niyogibacteria bacterium]|nr:hypothetical protein [Candidatus Niyogibacteria bacterium]
MRRKFIFYRDGLGTLIGMIFGAGVFALPFSFAKAGVGWGIAHFAVAFFLMVALHLMYGEIAYLTPGQHRFTGYVRKYLGRKQELLAFATTLLGYYGTLLVYGLLGGIFLHVFFPALSITMLTLIFFAVASAASLFRFEKIGAINFYLTIPIFLFVFYLFGISVSSASFQIENFMIGSRASWFLPYGIWLFALSGFSAVAEARDLSRGATLPEFKRLITLSLALSAFVYFVFIAAVLGVSGAGTTEDAITGLSNGIGRIAVPVGSLVGLLAVFTSYIALSADLIGIFMFDYRRARVVAWFATAAPAIAIYLAGATDLIKILGLVGAVGFGLLGVFIVKMARRLHRSFPEHRHILLGPRSTLRWVLMAGLTAGVVLEIANLF